MPLGIRSVTIVLVTLQAKPMTIQNLTLSIPSYLYEQIRDRANQRQHSVEVETLELLAGAVPADQVLAADLSAVESQLTLLDDEALWRAARSHLATDAASELESLHLKQQRQGLTTVEEETAQTLVRQYERAMLIRLRAAAVLHERGHDITVLLARP